MHSLNPSNFMVATNQNEFRWGKNLMGKKISHNLKRNLSVSWEDSKQCKKSIHNREDLEQLTASRWSFEVVTLVGILERFIEAEHNICSQLTKWCWFGYIHNEHFPQMSVDTFINVCLGVTFFRNRITMDELHS